MRFIVENMHCEGCAKGVTAVVKEADPSAQVEVRLDDKSISINGGRRGGEAGRPVHGRLESRRNGWLTVGGRRPAAEINWCAIAAAALRCPAYSSCKASAVIPVAESPLQERPCFHDLPSFGTARSLRPLPS